MRFWGREIAGWLLMVLGLFVFYTCLEYLANRRAVEAGIIAVIGVFIFRGGIHLLKVAIAARVCLDAQSKLEDPRPPRKEIGIPYRVAPRILTRNPAAIPSKLK